VTPGRLVAWPTSNVLIVPVPAERRLWGQGAIEGRACVHHIVATTRATSHACVSTSRETLSRLRCGFCAVGPRAGRRFLPPRPDRLHCVGSSILLPSVQARRMAPSLGAHGLTVPAPSSSFFSLIEARWPHVIECDDAFTEMFGYTAEELIARRCSTRSTPKDQAEGPRGRVWLGVLHDAARSADAPAPRCKGRYPPICRHDPAHYLTQPRPDATTCSSRSIERIFRCLGRCVAASPRRDLVVFILKR